MMRHGRALLAMLCLVLPVVTASGAVTVTIGNPSFEAPVTATFNNTSSLLVGYDWVFSSNGSGVCNVANTTWKTPTLLPAPQGSQVCLLAKLGTISQVLNVTTPGTYTLRYTVARRNGPLYVNTLQTFVINFGSRLDILTYQPTAPDATSSGRLDVPASQGVYETRTVDFTVAAGANTLAFIGTNLNGGECTAYFDDLSLQMATPAAPTAPTGLTAEALLGSSIKLTWTDNANDEDSYIVERSATGGAPWTAFAPLSANATSYTDTGLTALTQYHYRVIARNPNGDGASAVVSATAFDVPTPAPANLAASATSTSIINLTWADNATNEDNYIVERSTTGVAPWTVITSPLLAANTTSYTDTGLTALTQYYYRVIARGPNGDGVSAVVSATTFGALPLAPSNLAANATSASAIDLTWTDNANNEDNYIVERSATGAAPWTAITSPLLAANTTSYTDTGLAALTQYYYRVIARSTNGDGVSAVVSATTLGAPTPVPSNLAANATSASAINLTWTDNANNEDNYIVERSATGAAPWTAITSPLLAANTTSYTDTGLAALTQYYYRVIARGPSGDGVSAVVSATTLGAPPGPGSVTIGDFGFEKPVTTTFITQKATPLQSAWTFSLSDTNGASGVCHVPNGNWNPPQPVPEGSQVCILSKIATISQVLNITTPGVYQLRYTVGRRGGNVYKNTIQTFVINFGSRLDILTYQPTAPDNNSSGKLLAPALQDVYETRTVNFTVAAGANTLAFIGTNLNGGECTAFFDDISLQTAAPAAPTGLTARALAGSNIGLTWTDNANDEDNYIVERSATGVAPWAAIATLGTNVTTYTDTGLTALTKYYYRVIARNPNGDGISAVVSATAFDVPTPAPSNLAANATSTSVINLTWADNSNNEDNYIVERSATGDVPWAVIATLGANTTSYANTGLATLTQYYYRVIARGPNGDGISAVVSATTFDAPPLAPSNLAANATSASAINLTWTDNANNEANYIVERSATGAAPWTAIATLGANTISYTDTGLAALTQYYYRVIARSTNGDGGSAVVSATTFDAPPLAPSDLAANASSSVAITLTWTDIANNETGYRVERSDAMGGPYATIATLAANSGSYQNTGLARSTTYYYQIVAVNTLGETNSDKVSATTWPNTAPELVSGRALSMGSVSQNAPVPVGAVGTRLSSLITVSADGSAVVTDIDPGALPGIAVTATNSSHGSWYMSADDGATWRPTPIVSTSSALLLPANGLYRLYFAPKGGWTGAVVLTFRAWDQFVGTAENRMNPLPGGTSSAFSTNTNTIQVSVGDVIDGVTAESAGGGCGFGSGLALILLGALALFRLRLHAPRGTDGSRFSRLFALACVMSVGADAAAAERTPTSTAGQTGQTPVRSAANSDGGRLDTFFIAPPFQPRTCTAWIGIGFMSEPKFSEGFSDGASATESASIPWRLRLGIERLSTPMLSGSFSYGVETGLMSVRGHETFADATTPNAVRSVDSGQTTIPFTVHGGWRQRLNNQVEASLGIFGGFGAVLGSINYAILDNGQAHEDQARSWGTYTECGLRGTCMRTKGAWSFGVDLRWQLYSRGSVSYEVVDNYLVGSSTKSVTQSLDYDGLAATVIGGFRF